MKLFSTVILLFSSALSLLAQPQIDTEDQISNLFVQERFYEVIKTQDDYYKTYPDALRYSSRDWIQYMRLASWLKINDITNLKKDLNNYLATDPGFAKEVDTMLRIFIDKKFFAEINAEGYISDPVFDSLRDYRPLLTRCDTVRGDICPARSCYDVGFYDLNISVFPDRKEIHGDNKIFFTVTEPTNVVQIDLFDNYQVQSIKMGGREFGTEALPGRRTRESIGWVFHAKILAPVRGGR